MQFLIEKEYQNISHYDYFLTFFLIFVGSLGGFWVVLTFFSFYFFAGVFF